ncbi:hypothetical protein M407DRAFT_209681 [Tulasnella calospora MUT 4182]|uniref:Actin-like ATPase domain-containing protein n=1 Tax=Tulasnella calospora MUT 4182 TaxID=1051891 RepID=A0A0C3MLB0_9AGAM|nr:hypothetical protein M407DRAFT_209681 [Tulasnella calospora MUT 4182]
MSAVPATPSRSSAAAAARADLLASSPHYTTTKRHSLYGTEDRIIIDPGSRVWKVGFSGEGRPRDVFVVKHTLSPVPTSASGVRDSIDEVEKERLMELELQDRLRSVFFNSLLADPKSRKVIVIESPLLPLAVKDMFARILFHNLEVPSVSFMPSHLLSLLSVGRVTGLVLDCGHTESTLLPVYASRPMFSNIRTSPLAGSRLTSHLRALLLLFASYRAPPTIIRAAAQPAVATRVPEEILTEALVEEVKAKCLFVGSPFDAATQPENDDSMDVDQPSSASTGTPSESGRSSRLSMSESQAPSSAASVSRASGSGVGSDSSFSTQEIHLRAMEELYKKHATATDIQMRVVPPPAHAVAAGSFNNARGTLTIPGWIRERAAEVLFEGGDIDERSVAELILDSLLKVPVDLRKTLASSILVVGGTAMLPGFIQRLHAEIIKTLESQPHPPASILSPRRGGQSTPTPSASGANTPPDAVTPTAVRFQHRQMIAPSPRRAYDPYATLRSIAPHIAILNNPSITNMVGHASPHALANAGKAPAFAPALIPWVGGSLAGALKISSEEVVRDRWDEAYERDQDAQRQELEDLAINTVTIEPETASPMKSPRKSQLRYRPPPAQPVGASIILEGGGLRPPAYSALPDWTRSPLSVGAPNVVWLAQQQSVPPV